ncbi:hypothetical protein LOK49_LG08G02417 [Camellia lanceoleosa]|uniref:Uncharacterized protein n=1 Tax=Camellia lanceoleosa TaxID=1840588 RepID=A0ACC0GNT6_9ERIC|nr:hypothetical protein LOK49_LG08G02417 [Camellia lanceoleosa]
MFPFNCVPDSALPHINRVEENHKVDFNGVLDMLPQIMTRSPIMIERLGIRPEYKSMEQGGKQCRAKNGSHGNRKLLSQEQVSEMSRKVIACVLTNVGFEASSKVPMEVLSQLLSCHIGGILIFCGASLGVFLQWVIQVIVLWRKDYCMIPLSWMSILKDKDVHAVTF